MTITETTPPRTDLIRASFPAELTVRSATDGTSPVLFGHFAVFNEWTEINSSFEGHFLERIAPGAFTKTISENRDRIRVLFQHGRDPQIGDKVLGSITELREEDEGVYYEVALFDTLYNSELLPGLRAGQYGASFRFAVVREDFDPRPGTSEHNARGLPERTLRELALRELGPVTFGAYSSATAGVRSMTDELIHTPRETTRIGEANREYKRAAEFVSTTPWAMHPPALATIIQIVAERRQGHRPTASEIQERIGAASKPAQTSDGPVAVIPIFGSITPKAGLMSDMSGATSLEGFRSMLADALNSADVKAILLNVDSPGGSVEQLDETATMIRDARGQKPIVASANAFAASAAYYLASQADELVVAPSGQVGSIGVWTAHQDLSALYADLGVDTTLISAGEYKVEGNPFEPLDPEAEAYLQSQVDAYYTQFIDAVAAGRGVDAKTVRDDYGKGRMLMAEPALAAGMVDRIESYDATLARLTAEHGTVAAPEQTASLDKTSGTEGQNAQATTAAPSHPAETEPRRDTQPATDTPTIGKDSRMQHIEEMRARRDEIKRELDTIAAEHMGERLDADTQDRWDTLKSEREDINERIKATEDRLAYVEDMASREGTTEPGASEGTGTYVTRRAGRDAPPENPFDLSAYHSRANSQEQLARVYTEGAKRAVDSFSYPHERAEKAETDEHISGLLAQDGLDREMAQRVITFGSPTYRRAFWKSMLSQALTDEEQRAMAAGAMLEARAMTQQGGVTVPLQIDPTVILSSNGSLNPLRRISRVVTTTSYLWQPVTSGGITAHYAAEATVATDDTPTLAIAPIQPERGQAFVPFSYEAGQDWGALESEMAREIQDAKDQLEAVKFFVGAGHGSNEPQGVLVGAGTVVGTSGNTAFAVADIYAMENALPARFQPGASWVSTNSMFQKVRQFDTAGGANLWVQLQAANPPELIGYPAYKATNAGTAGGALTSTARWGIFGDFSQYVIVDRVGMQIKLIPDLFGGTAAVHYPTGQSGVYALFRNSAGVVASNAFRVGTVT